jgi:hypothetical protein
MAAPMDGETMHRALEESNKQRAKLYVAIFRAAEKRVGREHAIAILREAIYKWGADQGDGLKCHAPANFDGIVADFAGVPDGGKMFQPASSMEGPDALRMHMQRCPLKLAWEEAGMSDDELALMCSIAAEADYGTLERAGFAIDIETWKPGHAGCCVLHVRRA